MHRARTLLFFCAVTIPDAALAASSNSNQPAAAKPAPAPVHINTARPVAVAPVQGRAPAGVTLQMPTAVRAPTFSPNFGGVAGSTPQTMPGQILSSTPGRLTLTPVTSVPSVPIPSANFGSSNGPSTTSPRPNLGPASSGYTFSTNASGMVQVFQNGQLISTGTAQNATPQYGYQAPATSGRVTLSPVASPSYSPNKSQIAPVQNSVSAPTRITLSPFPATKPIIPMPNASVSGSTPIIQTPQQPIRISVTPANSSATGLPGISSTSGPITSSALPAPGFSGVANTTPQVSGNQKMQSSNLNSAPQQPKSQLNQDLASKPNVASAAQIASWNLSTSASTQLNSLTSSGAVKLNNATSTNGYIYPKSMTGSFGTAEQQCAVLVQAVANVGGTRGWRPGQPVTADTPAGTAIATFATTTNAYVVKDRYPTNDTGKLNDNQYAHSAIYLGGGKILEQFNLSGNPGCTSPSNICTPARTRDLSPAELKNYSTISTSTNSTVDSH